MGENAANTNEAASTEVFPDWYDAAKHVACPGGIYESGTGVLLAEDGEPASMALRAARARAVAEAEEGEAALAEIERPARKPRDTRQIVEGAALAAAQKE
jgi:hypothetical protein